MKRTLINDRIRSPIIKLVSANGEMVGDMTRERALFLARQAALDLVMVSEGSPPVCRLMDYGKLCYKQSKSEKKHHGTDQKETWIRTDTAQHDLDIKMGKVKQWLDKGMSVRIVLKLEGRQRHREELRNMGKQKLLEAAQSVGATLTEKDIQDGGGKEMSIVVRQ